MKPKTSETWPIVLAFAKIMEERLEANRFKGNREGWIDNDPVDLSNRIEDELIELHRSIQSMDDVDCIANEAADVANFAMMVADCFIDLTKPSET